MKYIRLFSMFLLLGFAVGCQDLLVDNVIDPDRTAALAEAGAVQNLIASSWTSVWNISNSNGGIARRIIGYADEGTSNHRNLIDYTSEPRQSFPNNQVGAARFLVQAPWRIAYEGAANAMDGLAAIERGEIDMPTDAGASTTEASNDRSRAFAWLNHGILYGYLAMVFDQAATADLDTDLENPDELEYRPYPEVRQFALTSLQNAADIAAAAPAFETPSGWMGGVALTNDEMVRLANSYMARLLVYSARNPAERAAVDWDRVIDLIDAGIQEDIVVQMTTGGLSSSYFQYLMQTLAQRYAADYRLIGPADVSGAYAAWVDAPHEAMDTFNIVTPDRRITGEDESGNPDPRARGKYFRWTDEAINVHDVDPYLMGRYKWSRFADQAPFPWQEGQNPIMTVAEMDLLKAEALLRLNRPEEAAELINRTRVENGELPPVTAAGVPGDLSSCVPRTQTGDACGSLMAALHYERLIEGVGLDVWLTWFNRRGFGTLQEGTFEQLPVPAHELEAFRQDVYTFGGGGEYSADADETVQ